jgi:hypothetical protein
MKTLLLFSAAVEAATGLLLLAIPSIVVELLTGSGLAGGGIAAARIAGISLISLSVACWLSSGQAPAFFGLLTYNALVALYLGYLGVRGEATGIVLWLAVAFHVIVTVLLAVGRRKALATGRASDR